MPNFYAETVISERCMTKTHVFLEHFTEYKNQHRRCHGNDAVKPDLSLEQESAVASLWCTHCAQADFVFLFRIICVVLHKSVSVNLQTHGKLKKNQRRYQAYFSSNITIKKLTEKIK